MPVPGCPGASPGQSASTSAPHGLSGELVRGTDPGLQGRERVGAEQAGREAKRAPKGRAMPACSVPARSRPGRRVVGPYLSRARGPRELSQATS